MMLGRWKLWTAAALVAGVGACSGGGTDDGETTSSSGTSGQTASGSSGQASSSGASGQASSSGASGQSSSGASGAASSSSGASGASSSSSGASGSASGGSSSGASSSSSSSSSSSGGNGCPINGEIICGGSCVNPLTDVEWCGATGDCLGGNSGTQCLGGKSCINGSCQDTCPTNYVLCGNTCINPATSNAFCGASGDCLGVNAGQQCTGGEMCDSGLCTSTCSGVQCGGGAANMLEAAVARINNSSVMGGLTFAQGLGEPVHLSVALTGNTSPDFPAGQAYTVALLTSVTTNNADPCNLANLNAAMVTHTLGTFSAGAGTLAIDQDFPDLSFGGGGATDVENKVLVFFRGATATGTTTRRACAVLGQAVETAIPPMCIDPATDPVFCGASLDCAGANAGETCDTGEVCEGGLCVSECPNAGEIKCGGVCIDPNTNNTYCGATAGCGMGAGTDGETCASGTECIMGACRALCPAGQISCGGNCVDPRTNNTYCGAYGDCAAGTAQAGGECSTGTQCNGDGACTRYCLPGLVLQGGRCVDPFTDNQFCGATRTTVGTTCAQGTYCSDGVCAAQCGVGLTLVDGKCLDQAESVYSCGTAGLSCALGQECFSPVGTAATAACVASTRTYLGALKRSNGAWAFAGRTPGFPGAVAECNAQFGDADVGLFAVPCTDTDLVVAEDRGDLDDAYMTMEPANAITSFWVHDKAFGGSVMIVNGLPVATTGTSTTAAVGSTDRARVCHHDTPASGTGNVSWTYPTGHLGYFGQWRDFNGTTDVLGDLANSGSNCGNSTRTIACCIHRVSQ